MFPALASKTREISHFRLSSSRRALVLSSEAYTSTPAPNANATMRYMGTISSAAESLESTMGNSAVRENHDQNEMSITAVSSACSLDVPETIAQDLIFDIAKRSSAQGFHVTNDK